MNERMRDVFLIMILIAILGISFLYTGTDRTNYFLWVIISILFLWRK
jgi:hypothetical protein